MTFPILARALPIVALATATLQAAVITWQFDYQGWSPEAQGAIESVAGYLSSQIQATADITLRIATGTTVPAGYLATTSPRFASTPSSFNVTAAQAAIQAGVLVAGAHATVHADLTQAWGYGETVGPGQFDFRDVMLHELTHALGVAGLIGVDGNSVAGLNRYSTFDQFVLGWNGTGYQPLVQRDALGTPAGPALWAASALVDTTHPLLFNGPATQLLGGGPVPLSTLNPFQSGSSIYHLAEAGDLLHPAAGPGDRPGVYSDLHRAVLTDLGYTVVPEPSAFAGLSVLLIGSAWLWGRPGRQRVPGAPAPRR